MFSLSCAYRPVVGGPGGVTRPWETQAFPVRAGRRLGLEGAFWGIGAALGFGTGDFIARFTTRRIGAEASLLIVIFLGFVGLSIWLFWPGAANLERYDFAGWLTGPGLFWSVASGAANVFGLLTLFMALARGPVSLAAPIVAANPAVVLLCLIPFGFVPGPIHLLGVVATLGGVAVLSRFAEIEQTAIDAPEGAAQGPGKTIRLSLYSMCGIAMAVLFAQEAANLHGPLLAGWGMRFFGFLWLALWYCGFRRRRVSFPRGIRLALLAQAFLEAAGSVCLLVSSIGEGRALAAVFASTFAVVLVVLGWLVLRERITGAQWLSMAVILMGVVILTASPSMVN